MRTLPRPPFSLNVQLTAVFGALVVLVAIAITLGLGQMLRERVRADGGRSLAVVASNAARILSDGLANNARIVDALARQEELWEGGLDSGMVRRTLATLNTTVSHSAWIGVADMAGEVRSATGGMLQGASVSERPWFVKAREGLFVGDLHPAKLLASLLPEAASGEPPRFLDYAAPIQRGGRTAGVLGVHVSWDWASEVIATVLPADALASGIEVFIFDRQGDVIYAPRGQSQRLAKEGMRIPALTPGASVVSWYGGASYLTVHARLARQEGISDLGWTIVVREPADAVFAAVQATTLRALLIGMLIAALAALLAGVAAHRLGADVRQMAQAVRDVEAGVAGARIPQISSSSEMSTLAKAVGGMTDRLLHARDELEQQVRERTQELRAANTKLSIQAKTDALTGLLNRHAFDPLLDHALARARRRESKASVLMVDVDHFKSINDRFGHSVGDQVLCLIADTLRGRLRASDVIARFGGEEFSIVLPEADVDTARAIAQAIVHRIASIEDPVWGRVTVSAGVATYDGANVSAGEMLRRADEALYCAKREGRNRVCAYESSV